MPTSTASWFAPVFVAAESSLTGRTAMVAAAAYRCACRRPNTVPTAASGGPGSCTGTSCRGWWAWRSMPSTTSCTCTTRQRVTRPAEFRDPAAPHSPTGTLGRLRMVSIIDVLADGLSSVYTFYDPDEVHASFGTYNVMWQIAQCRALQLPYLYLGYWIEQSTKMSYKANFRPVEMLRRGHWVRRKADFTPGKG